MQTGEDLHGSIITCFGPEMLNLVFSELHYMFTCLLFAIIELHNVCLPYLLNDTYKPEGIYLVPSPLFNKAYSLL